MQDLLLVIYASVVCINASVSRAGIALVYVWYLDGPSLKPAPIRPGTLVHSKAGTLVPWYTQRLVPWYASPLKDWYPGPLKGWYPGTLKGWYPGTLKVYLGEIYPRHHDLVFRMVLFRARFCSEPPHPLQYPLRPSPPGTAEVILQPPGSLGS